MTIRIWYILGSGLAFVLLLCSFVIAETAKPLVSVSWLQDNLSNPDLVVLDIRSPNTRGNPYSEGHIPGARHAPYNAGWRERRDGIIGMLPERDVIVSHIRSLGVNATSNVVIVPHGRSSTDFGAATRVYWTFKVLGHNRVSILEGGYKVWNAVDGALSTDEAEFAYGDFDGEIDPTYLTKEQEVQISLRGGARLVDARPVKHFKGEVKSPVVLKAGTIPGAFNLQQSLLYDPTRGKFISRKRIDELAIKIGLSNQNNPVYTFCNTGHWASLAWFALHEVGARKDISLYDGSMAEWTMNDGNPVVVSID